MTNFELLNTPMILPSLDQPKTEADKWWDGLPDVMLHTCQMKCVGRICTGASILSRTAFNEGLKWGEGFEEWCKSLSTETSSAGFNITMIEGRPWIISKSSLQEMWNSIHTFKTKQAEGKR